MTEPDDIQPGVKTDHRVAKACRIALVPFPDQGAAPGYGTCAIDSEYGPIEFRPSTDWNHAMEAAERFGLFDEHVLAGGDREWRVISLAAYGHLDDGEISSDCNGPLAICRAIIALSEEADDRSRTD